ncbi:gelsolin-related protein of 125 kDa-like [Magallana gigas]|uniref:gelsolin-related protein of 125 kDa-like n=1 Tax=Magallana gigas TaxID=29159 RepID=UPI003341E311
MADHSKMESKSDIGNGPVINMERVPITKGQEIQRSDEKRANNIGNGEIQRRFKNIPVLEERRLLALERHIKRKRRRRPYVKKMKNLDKTGHQLDKTMASSNGEMADDPGAFDLKDERIQVSEGEGREGCILNKIVGTRMPALEKYEENQIDLQIKHELIENVEAQSTKMEVGKDKEQSVQFDKLVKYLLDGVKLDLLNIVEDELNGKRKEVEEEGKIKKDEGAGMEVKQENEENLTAVKEVNTSPPKDAWMEVNRVNDRNLKKEKENLQNEGHIKCSERAKDPETQTDHIRVENPGQSSSGPKEPKPKDSESEAIKSNELVKDGRDNEKTNTDIRNKLVLDDNENDDEEDDDEGFMPRKLFFFSFSEFKKEETSA